MEAFLASSKHYALSTAANLFKQLVVAKVHQHRRGAAGVSGPAYRFIRERAETRFQQTGAAGVLRRIGRNGCSAFATKSGGCDSHRVAIAFTQIMHGNSHEVTSAMRR